MSRRGPKTASDCERHFRMRLLQRYGIALGDRYTSCNREVQEGRATFDFKESNTRTHWTLEIEGKQVRVVYDRGRSALVTALPPIAGASGGGGALTSQEALHYGERMR